VALFPGPGVSRSRNTPVQPRGKGSTFSNLSAQRGQSDSSAPRSSATSKTTRRATFYGESVTVTSKGHHTRKNQHRRSEVTVGSGLLDDWTVAIRNDRVGPGGQQWSDASPKPEETRAVVRDRLRRNRSAPKRIGCCYRLTAFSYVPGRCYRVPNWRDHGTLLYRDGNRTHRRVVEPRSADSGDRALTRPRLSAPAMDHMRRTWDDPGSHFRHLVPTRNFTRSREADNAGQSSLGGHLFHQIRE
jgi:hypothetical protein